MTMTKIQQQFFGLSQWEILSKPQRHTIKFMSNFKRQFFLLFFCLFLLNFCCLFGKISANFTEEMLEEMEEDEEEMFRLRAGLQHNPKMPPVVAKGDPLRVFAGIYIESMSNFQAAQMSFDVDLYLYANWRDPSLNHSSRTLVLVNDPRVREKIWLPDLYVANAKTSKFHEVTAPNFNLFIANDGEIASSTRITMNVACNLDLTRYPMDHQKCAIRMLSYAFVASQVNVTWFSRQPTRYNRQIELPEYRIVSITGQYCDGTYSYAIMENSERRDPFSCLEAVILLQRQIGYHLVQSYIPTGLIVMVSWLSFWIDRSAAPARVTLSFTALLTLSTLGNGMRYGLPQVSYAKAIDFWFGACMFFVFLNLSEYAAVNSFLVISLKYDRLAKTWMERGYGKQTGRSRIEEFNEAERAKISVPLLLRTTNGQNRKDSEFSMEEEEWERCQRLAKEYDQSSVDIDYCSRFLFPATFAIWNAFYWGYYLWYTAPN